MEPHEIGGVEQAGYYWLNLIPSFICYGVRDGQWVGLLDLVRYIAVKLLAHIRTSEK